MNILDTCHQIVSSAKYIVLQDLCYIKDTSEHTQKIKNRDATYTIKN